MKKSSLAKATDVAKLKKTVAKSSKEIAKLKSKLATTAKALSKMDKKIISTSTDLKELMTTVSGIKVDLSLLSESAKITDYLLCYTRDTDGTKKFKLTIDVDDLNPLSDIEVPVSPEFNSEGNAEINLIRRNGSHSEYNDLVVFSGKKFPRDWNSIILNIMRSTGGGSPLDSIGLPPVAPDTKDPEIECPS